MKQKQQFIIIVLLFIFVLVFVIVNIYHNLNESTISENTSKEILPIDSSFDTRAIDRLKKREKVNPVFELENLPTPVPTKTPIASPSSNLNREQSLFQGGQATS